MNECLTCGKPAGVKFCSRSCSAKYNNSAYPKRLPEGTCADCGEAIPSSLKRCPDCYAGTSNRVDLPGTTKFMALTNDTQRYRKIRAHARSIAHRAGILEACFLCGYSTYVETCHVVDVASFPDDALVSAINSPDNLVGLCRNHHWEFDHGKLSQEHTETLVGAQRIEL